MFVLTESRMSADTHLTNVTGFSKVPSVVVIDIRRIEIRQHMQPVIHHPTYPLTQSAVRYRRQRSGMTPEKVHILWE